jgi:hypothetical protein
MEEYIRKTMQARLRKTMQLSVLVNAEGMEIVITKNIIL